MSDPHTPLPSSRSLPSSRLPPEPSDKGSHALCCGPWRDKKGLMVPGSIDVDIHTSVSVHPELVTQEMLALLNQVLAVLPSLADRIRDDVRNIQQESEKRLQGMLEAMERRLQAPKLSQETLGLSQVPSSSSLQASSRLPVSSGDSSANLWNTETHNEMETDSNGLMDFKKVRISTTGPDVAEDTGAEAQAVVKQGDGSTTEATREAKKPLRNQFLLIFNELDLNKEGHIDRSEMDHFLDTMGLPKSQADKAFAVFDQDLDGKIGRQEFLNLIMHFEENQADPELASFLACMTDRWNEAGCIYEKNSGSRCLLDHDSVYRVAWDMVTLLLLTYIALTMPLSLAFGFDNVFRVPDTITDCLFMVDVAINFRTTYINRNSEKVTHAIPIARHYLKTWFVLDFFSSIPFDFLSSGIIPGLQPFKLVKASKLGKVLKVLRLSKVLKILEGSAFIQDFEQFIWSNHCGKAIKFAKLLVLLMVSGHWLACLLISVDGPSLEQYLVSNGEPLSHYQTYLSAMYWAMMTLSTVGYGDISMRSKGERILAIVAMMAGGSFYAYLVGSITTLVADNDLNSRAYKDRMNLVEAWLDFHDELPRALRKRIWIHFKEHLATRTAVEDSIVMNDLPANLKHILSGHLLHDDVRYNQLFDGLPPSEFPHLVLAVQHTARAVDENICFKGERGHAMFIIHTGIARKVDENDKLSKLSSGESFGEEILMAVCVEYEYTVVAESKCALMKIPQESFNDQFAGRPDLLDKMKRNLEKSTGGRAKRSGSVGSSSVLEGGQSGLSPTFPDALFQTLNELIGKVDMLTQVRAGEGQLSGAEHLWQMK